MIRNVCVLHERTQMLVHVFKQADWPTILGLHDQVTYSKMMLHFWVWPIHKMWPAELQELRK